MFGVVRTTFCASVSGFQALPKIVFTISMQPIFLIPCLKQTEAIYRYWINQLCSLWYAEKNLYGSSTLILKMWLLYIL